MPIGLWNLKQFTATNSLRTATKSENVLQFLENKIYVISGSSCLQGKNNWRDLFLLLFVNNWVCSCKVKPKYCRMEIHVEKNWHPLVPQIFLIKGRRETLPSMVELRSNSGIGWESKKGNWMLKNCRILIERNKGKKINVYWLRKSM